MTRHWWRYCIALSAAAAASSLAVSPAWCQAPPAPADRLQNLSIEDLSNLDVTSVSGVAQPLNEAPAAIYVISSDDITRAGIRSIPGALRLAPNLQVARIDAANYAVTARGFNHSSGTSNKLLVLMDGRIVYTPLFSGVFWDEQNAIMEDIDRIEVVSGPGGTLWGSNAVNGVINIVSRDAHETTGMLVTGAASESSGALGLRYGARFGDAGAFRIYGLGLRRGIGESGEFQNLQAGFRADGGDAQNALTLQGDLYAGDQVDIPGQVVPTQLRGGNLLGRWTRRFADDSALRVQTYIDRTSRQVKSGIKADVDSAALDAQYDFTLSRRHALVVGGGTRLTKDEFRRGPGTVFLDPDSRTLRTFNIYAQDTISLTSSLDFILGLKGEHNSYTGMEYMPSARLAWRVSDHDLLWAAASRAVRTPSRFDTDLINPGLIAGGPDFISEEVTAYELGYRGQPSDRLWFSVSAYYNVYDDLRTVEASGPSVYPLVIRNGMHGETYGLEAWGAYALTDWWRLNGGLSLLRKDLALDAGSTDVFGVGFAGNDPEAQATLRSLMDVGARATFDVSGRAVAELPSPKVPAYVAIDMRFGYRVTDRLELALTGSNLFDDHVEFINPSLPPREATRTFAIAARWRR